MTEQNDLVIIKEGDLFKLNGIVYKVQSFSAKGGIRMSPMQARDQTISMSVGRDRKSCSFIVVNRIPTHEIDVEKEPDESDS